MNKLRYDYTTGELGAPIETISYIYGNANWKDMLTEYDGQALEHNAIGNLTDDGMWTYAWHVGRQLASMTNAAAGVTMEFKYNHNGLRTQKVKKVNGVVTETTDYQLHGKLITHLTKGANSMHFYYDAQNCPAMVNFNDSIYSYVHNLQGDVIGIVDSTGTVVVEYWYDAWGKPTDQRTLTTEYEALAELNPFRYRGYVYDEETGLYYLRSRYYNITSARFINADTRLNARGFGINIYSYCGGNPIVRVDDGGFVWYNDIWNWAKNAALDTVNWTSNAVVDGWNWTYQAVSDAVDWTTQAATDAWNWTAQAGTDAWNWTVQAGTDAWYWMKQAATNVAKFMQDSYRYQAETNILFTQLSINAADNIDKWISNNWRAVIDWTGYVYTGVCIGLSVTEKLIASFTLSTPVGWALIGIDIIFWIYEGGEKVGWW